MLKKVIQCFVFILIFLTPLLVGAENEEIFSKYLMEEEISLEVPLEVTGVETKLELGNTKAIYKHSKEEYFKEIEFKDVKDGKLRALSKFSEEDLLGEYNINKLLVFDLEGNEIKLDIKLDNFPKLIFYEEEIEEKQEQEVEEEQKVIEEKQEQNQEEEKVLQDKIETIEKDVKASSNDKKEEIKRVQKVSNVEIKSNITNKIKAGTEITLTASSKGSDNPEYKFYLEKNGVWKVLSDYSKNHILKWTPNESGNYKIVVHARDEESKDKYQSYSTLTYHVTSQKVKEIKVELDKKSPQPRNTNITIKANSSGSDNPLYRFWIEKKGNWIMLQDYSSNNKFNWYPKESGKYKFSIHTKDKYSENTYDKYSAFYYTIKNTKTTKEVSVNFDKPTGQIIDEKINIKASSKGIENPMYKFYIEKDGVWNVLQDYSFKNTFSWNPQEIGNYKVVVHAKNKDSKEKYESYIAYKYNIKQGKVKEVELDFEHKTSQTVFRPVNITAKAVGSNKTEFKFFLLDNGVWKVLREYSSKNTYTWIPDKPGMYKFSVHSRDINSKEKYEAYKASYFKIDSALVYYNNYYNYTYDEFLETQLKKNPQTDSYGGGWKTAKAEDVSKYLNPSNFLQFNDEDKNVESKIKVIIDTPALNVRTTPTVNGSKVIDVVFKGEEYTVIGKENDWYKIQTNSCTGWIHSGYVKTKIDFPKENKSLKAIEINTSVLNVRSNPNTDCSILTQVGKGEVFIVQEEQYGWYKINANGILGWISSNYTKSTNQAPKDMYQFLVLSGSSEIAVNDLNKVLADKGILANQASAFIKASEIYNINEIYLLSHALLETGNGWSTLARGVLVDTVDGKKVTPRIVYNMYGIGAYDSSPLKSGSEYAYKAGWFTPQDAIIGGAKFISEEYVNNSSHKQDTLYKMRWNPETPGSHQYATDIGWAYKQINRIKQLYDQCTSFILKFDIPKFLKI